MQDQRREEDEDHEAEGDQYRGRGVVIGIRRALRRVDERQGEDEHEERGEDRPQVTEEDECHRRESDQHRREQHLVTGAVGHKDQQADQRRIKFAVHGALQNTHAGIIFEVGTQSLPHVRSPFTGCPVNSLFSL